MMDLVSDTQRSSTRDLSQGLDLEIEIEADLGGRVEDWHDLVPRFQQTHRVQGLVSGLLVELVLDLHG